ncbi:peroxidase [Rhizobium tropici]|uniref:Peroxidase n=1 Tax=Rhizobium tropici TaxID=398 RepID=A0A5B0VPY3_RHITR|nr:hexameric tyrosine-coordinated heme protein [Rhizobium tropici]KAA1176523.1 peroxidase [Rhizobium tropici]
MAESWLVNLKTTTPEAGWQLAVKMSRTSIEILQPSEKIRNKIKVIYEDDAESLIAFSQLIAMNFQTVAAANRYWQEMTDDASGTTD